MKSYYFLAALVLLASCQKKEELDFSLTPATQVGANTLSFTVEGHVFQPYGSHGTGIDGGGADNEPLKASYKPRTGELHLNAFLSTKERLERFSLHSDSVFQVGPARIRFTAGTPLAGLTYTTSSQQYRTADAQTAIRITRLDTVAHIISGTFEGYLQNDYYQGQPVTSTWVKDGRFDVQYTK